MVKKKGKDRSPRADSSTDTAGVSCIHIRKGTDHSLLKKAGLNEQWSSCQDCEPDKPVEKQILEDETDRESPAVWMCLKCGHRGCGRSENQHAIKHYETPRSEPHCLVLSLDVWSVWCYICDDEVQYSRTRQLTQLIRNIKKKQVLTDPGKETKKVLEKQGTRWTEFAGEMSSTVMCKECRTVSLVTEMFLDLSLPVTDEDSPYLDVSPVSSGSADGALIKHKMGKKKGKDRSPRADSSTDTAGVSCTHIRKGTDHSLLKKAGLNEQWSSCQDCEPDKPVEKQILEDETDRESPAVWMCLKCGHRGCGRSENQHAIKHYETPRSEPHCLVLSLDVWSVWCYICDEEVQYSRTGQLAQLITNIKKQVLTDPGKKNSNRKSKKEESLETNPVEHTLDEEKENENKEKQKSSSKHDDSPKKQKTAAAGSSGVVSVRGLSNLGNTCFFNAVVQNLSQTQFLRELLNKITDEKSCFTITPALLSELEPLKIQLERPGSLTLAMCQLLNEIKETKKSVVTPKELFTQVCKKAPRFKGFQQQDSQELLRYLLDGVRAEELKRVNSGILEALKSSGKSLGAEQMKKVIKEYEKNGAPKNFVDRVFGGEMCSTVMCKECRTVSLVTEMFLDLSLPVADEAYRKKNQKKVAQHRSSVSDDGENTTSLTNGNEDMPTGTGSKYQQKKAKKQAKKQAKTQRRQQKLGSKVTLDALTNQSTASSTDPVDASNQSVSVNGSADAEAGENSQENLSPEKPPAVSQNEDEDDEEPEQEHSTSVNNRFNALTEDQTSEDVSVEEDKPQDVNATEEENGADQPCAEEDQLVEELNTLTLKTASEGEMENGDESSGDAKEYTVVNQDPELAFKSLASRTAPEKQECSVESCLYQFTEVEHLIENNRLLCGTCTKSQSGHKGDGKKAVYRDALKQMLISDPPAVLTLHLKRFQQVSYTVCKVNRHVQFPQILDLAPFCSLNCKGVKEGETQVLYSLYGIVEHSGTMRSGHYTAYVKSRPSTRSHVENGLDADCHAETSKGSWFHISDSSVHPVTEAKVQTSQAYLLFYERIS
ncbi:ubiquitin carboxyl-terminal hydrolase 16-like isoform X1 [Labeo rohita]|nr:ubiquitin carboxyl-terminal hydrolase 16-like isoform X1 [Labeo rohita]